MESIWPFFFRGSFDNLGGDFPGSACAGVGVPYLTLRFGGFPSDDGQMVGVLKTASQVWLT